MSADELIDYVRATFGLDRVRPATLTPSGRGALGQIPGSKSDPAGTPSRSCSTTRLPLRR
jgi:hypothetical protein